MNDPGGHVRTIGFLALVTLGMSALPAWGACPQGYGADALGRDLGDISTALRGDDNAGISGPGQRLSDGLPCITAPMAPVVLSRAYRFIGLHHYLIGDEAKARRWFRTALELDSTYEWDVRELAVDDPLRAVFEQERSSGDVEPTALEGKTLASPAGSRILLDGRTVSDAKATLDRPHLVQVVSDASNSVTAIHLIDGNQFPAGLLSEEMAVAVAEEKPRFENDYAVQTIERSRPPLKTPMLVGGAIGVVGGIGMYSASFITHKKFEEATTTTEVNQYRTLTNTLVLGAASSFVVGMGFGYFGVILNAGPGLGWTGQF